MYILKSFVPNTVVDVRYCMPVQSTSSFILLYKSAGDDGDGLWALVSPDGVAPSRMVDVSASVNLPLHYKVQRFSSGTGSPGWSQKKGP